MCAEPVDDMLHDAIKENSYFIALFRDIVNPLKKHTRSQRVCRTGRRYAAQRYKEKPYFIALFRDKFEYFVFGYPYSYALEWKRALTVIFE